MHIKIGTRASLLAKTQSEMIGKQLEAAGHTVEYIFITTTGDKFLGDLMQVGGKGVFVKEIEEALLAKEIDLAIHSLKDMPAEIPAGLMLAAFPQREDARDVLITRNGEKLTELPQKANIGSSSLRRQLQLQNIRTDFQFSLLRGNVDTRIRKLKSGEYDAIILAAAGLNRLNYQKEITQYLSLEDMVPAVGQGILALEARSDDLALREVLQKTFNHFESELAATCERAFLKTLGGDCRTPLGCHAVLSNNQLAAIAWFAAPKTLHQATMRLRGEATLQAADSLGKMLARQIQQKVITC